MSTRALGFYNRLKIRYVLGHNRHNKTSTALVVLAAADDFLARWSKNDCVLELRRVAAFDVAQRRVRIDHVGFDETLQRQQVFALAESVQPATAERQCAEVLADRVVQLLRFRISTETTADMFTSYPSDQVSMIHSPDKRLFCVEVLHVVRHFHIVVHDAFSCAAERFDGVDLAFLHRSDDRERKRSERERDC